MPQSFLGIVVDRGARFGAIQRRDIRKEAEEIDDALSGFNSYSPSDFRTLIIRWAASQIRNRPSELGYHRGRNIAAIGAKPEAIDHSMTEEGSVSRRPVAK